MGLVDKLKESGKRVKDLALAGALGSSVYLSGCGPALMGLGAGTPGARGAALYAFGSGVTQLEAAEAGKSEVKQTVNVNGGQSNYESSSKGLSREETIKRFSTAYNYWIDENNNGMVDYNELKGAGDIFFLSKEKQLSFSTFIEGHKGDYLHFYLYDSNNQPIALRQGIPITMDPYLGDVLISGEELENLSSKSRGKCLANWRIGKATEWTGVEPVIDQYIVHLLR